MSKIFSRSDRRGLFGSLLASGFVCACLALTAGGCASIPVKPMPRDQMNGSTWKLVVAAGRMDHRVIQFEQKAGGAVVGVLKEKGRILSQIVGVNEGMEMFSLTPSAGTAQNQYEGLYRTVSSDGRLAESRVSVTFYEDHFDWTLESATWSRVQ